MRNKSRIAFTLVELLVVIAIIAILIALLLPAVQKVREAAARVKCQNNLKQLALGYHMYNDQNGVLAPGVWVTGTGNNGYDQNWGWGVLLLPYIEQADLYHQLNLPQDLINGGVPGVNALLVIPLSVYLCPSDPTETVNGYMGGYARSNYVVNRMVTGPNAPEAADPGNGSYWDDPSQNTLAMVTDGTSNTILLGERDMYKTTGAVWAGVVGDDTTASFEGRPTYGEGRGINVPVEYTNTAGQTATAPPMPSALDPFNEADATCNRLGFTSMHPNGVNFAMVDGSVHFILNSVQADPGYSGCTFPVPGPPFNNYVLSNLYNPQDDFPLPGSWD
jgi:prepilin-type N-terminal cleavage/methylation domain-containing protein/prepilin-type processing-associated H-X9-DG protein